MPQLKSVILFYICFMVQVEHEDAWSTLGRACQILDNLIAQGKAKRMIVVMTNGNYYQAAVPGEAPENANKPAPSFGGPGGNGSGKFETSLVKDVVPFIESHYQVLTDKNNRAIAGLSMGGMHTQNITNNNPGMFGYIGIMSMGLMDLKAMGINLRVLNQTLTNRLKRLKRAMLSYIGSAVVKMIFYMPVCRICLKSSMLTNSNIHIGKVREDILGPIGGSIYLNWLLYCLNKP